MNYPSIYIFLQSIADEISLELSCVAKRHEKTMRTTMNRDQDNDENSADEKSIVAGSLMTVG
tara:strand:+ start:155713 stop:155898 length:186 start_codon:yes stop_codon:yes gene_type:complete